MGRLISLFSESEKFGFEVNGAGLEGLRKSGVCRLGDGRTLKSIRLCSASNKLLILSLFIDMPTWFVRGKA